MRRLWLEECHFLIEDPEALRRHISRNFLSMLANVNQMANGSAGGGVSHLIPVQYQHTNDATASFINGINYGGNKIAATQSKEQVLS
jgi:hypothetical protein